jgi:V/A-type H+-transporting ATPase subunit B
MLNNHLEYCGIDRATDPIIVLKRVSDVGYGEIAEIMEPSGEMRQGRVISISSDTVTVEVFRGVSGLSKDKTRIRFLGKPFEIRVSREETMGRIFDGAGRPLDGGPAPMKGEARDIRGKPINPLARTAPKEVILTGISAIDGMNTLVRGQKLPIYSGSGLPHNALSAQIVRQAGISVMEEGFAIVFAAIGIRYDEAHAFKKVFEESGVLKNVVMFLNLAENPTNERLITPRIALTTAEHLAFDHNMHVLVILTDMTNYCEALREAAVAGGEVPSRRGYPTYLYSDLASIFERAGRIKGISGSITQLPILTMPDDDINHPIPDITGYITEGQIVLERALHQRDIYPPVNILTSLSRVMNDGIGKEATREDHKDLANQLYASYAKARSVRRLATVIGEEDLSSLDRSYLLFAKKIEEHFINQKHTESRDINEILDRGWAILRSLPETEFS